MSSELPQHIVGIDVETTALDPAHGEIIEIAAIRYDTEAKKEIDRFHHLCKPSEPISDEITRITTITNEMVEGKPSYADINSELASFLKNDPLFAHNAPFDVKWISTFGPDLHARPVWDTFPLATIAWPEASSYNLGSLARMLEIPVQNEHRADADVAMTWELLTAIHAQLTVDNATYDHIVEVLQSSQLSHYIPLFTKGAPQPALSKGPLKAPKGTTEAVPKLDRALSTPGVSTWVNRLHGPHSSAHVLAALKHSREARTVLATDTGWRLTRLADDTVPALQTEHDYTDVPVATLRHPAAYVCAQRIADVRSVALPPADALQLVRLLVWLDTGGTGEIDRLNLTHQPITPLLALVSADSPRCGGPSCTASACPYRTACQAADTARLILTTHRALAQQQEDARTPYAARVIENVHRLEESLREAGRHILAPFRLQALVHDLILEIDDDTVAPKLRKLLKEYEGVAQKIADAPGTATPIEIMFENLPAQKQNALKKGVASWVEHAKLTLGFAAPASPDNPSSTTLLASLEECVTQVASLFTQAENRIQWIATASSPDSPFLLNDLPRSVSADLTRLLQSTVPTLLCSPVLTSPLLTQLIEQRVLTQVQNVTHISPTTTHTSAAKLLLTSDTAHPNDGGFSKQVAQLTHAIATQLQGQLLVLGTSKSGLQELHQDLYSSLNKESYKILTQGVTGSPAQITRVFNEDPKHIVLLRDWEGRYSRLLAGVRCVLVPKLPFPRPHDPVVESLASYEGVSSFSAHSIPSVIQSLLVGIGSVEPPQDSSLLVVLLDSRLATSGYGKDIQRALGRQRITVLSAAQITDEVQSWRMTGSS